MLDSSRRILLYSILGVLCLGVFIIDAVAPPELTVELLQVAVVLLTLFAEGRRPTLLFGGLSTGAVGGGYWVHAVQEPSVAVQANYGITILGLWMAVGVVLAYKQVLRSRRESEARARAVLDTTVDGILTMGVEGTIRSFNPAAEDLFGYDAAEVVGTPLPALIAPSDRAVVEEALRRYRDAGHAALIGDEQVLQGKRRDGTTFPIELSLSETELRDRSFLTGIVRDVTDRIQDERRLTTQYRTARVLTDSDSLADAAPRLLRTVCEHLDWERGELWLPNADRTRLESAETWSLSASDDASAAPHAESVTFRRGEGLPGVVWEEQQPRWLSDVQADDTFERAAVAEEEDMRAGCAFPIRIDGTVLGVMVFFSRDIRAPDEGLVQMFSVIGNQIGQFAERRQAEEALQRTAERLGRAQEIAGLGSWEYDLETGTMIWSEQMYRLFGVDPDTFCPSLELVKDFLPSDDRARFEEALAQVRDGAESVRLEHRLRVDGERRWAFTQGEVEGNRLVGTTLDTTELTQTKKALEESEARAQAILETTVDGIITIDPDGLVESFNPAAEAIFGYDAEEVIGENVKMLMPSPYREEHDEYLRSYHETGRRNIIGVGREVTGLRKDGSTFPMDLAVSEVDLGDRTIFTGIVRDISERRRLETEILNVSEQERRRIGQDLHDGLGQMLTGIGLLSQDLARQLEDEDHERADDMAEITEHIKEADQYARDLSHGLIPVDVEANGLPEALRRLSDNAERLFNVECAFQEVDTALVHDNTTATHLYRIAQEAVNNAVRHGDADHVTLRLAAGDEQIRLQVRDDGTGFDEDDVTDAGMGVHIMNYRARIIGGTLDLNSTLGEGTVVTCTLARTAGSGTTPEPAEAGDAGGTTDGAESGSNGTTGPPSCPV